MEKERKESAARRKILDTATDLFYRNGIRATGIDCVIAQADVARMTLYKHFPSKDALVDAVLDETSARMEASLAEALAEAPPSPRDRVLAIFDWQAKTMQCDAFRGCPFFNTVVESPDHESVAYQTAVRHKGAVRDILAANVAALGVADPDLLSEQLALLMEGASMRAQMGHACAAAKAARSAAERLMDAAAR